MIRPRKTLTVLFTMVALAGFMTVACKKSIPPDKKQPLSQADMQQALQKKCDSASSNDSMAIPDAGELYNLVEKMGLGQALTEALQKQPVKLDKATGSSTAYVLGLALAEQTLTVSPKNLTQTLPKIKDIYTKAKAANLLDKASQSQVESLLKKLESVKKTEEFRSFLSLVRAEFLKRMREKQYRYQAMLVLSGGLLLSYHEISRAASQQTKVTGEVGEILSFSDPVQLLAHELGACFATQTKQDAGLQKVVSALQKLEKLLSSHKGKFEQKTLATIATITGDALQSYR